jgi:carbonic anhydrase
MLFHVRQAHCASTRRRFLATGVGVCTAARTDSIFAQLGSAGSASLTKQQRDGLSVVQVIDELRKGNERFRTGKLVSRDYRDQQRTTAAGQFPAAVVLGCIDSRATVEIILDVGIGDTFNVRVAGNVFGINPTPRTILTILCR